MADTHFVSTNRKSITVTATHLHRHAGEVLSALIAGQDVEVIEKRHGTRLVLIRAVED